LRVFSWEFNQVTTVFYVDALAGSGKTFAATRHAYRLARCGEKILIVQPSIRLIQQTLADLTSLTPQVRATAIYGSGPHGAGTSSNVVGDIVRHSRDTAAGGEVLLITHAAFMRLPYFHRRHQWHLLMDEIPQADWSDELSIADTHQLITDHIAVEADESSLAGNRYVQITPKNQQALEAMLDNGNRDEVWGRFNSVVGKVLSEHWRTYTLDEQFCALMDDGGDRRSLSVFAVLRPSMVDGFITSTIMGACFKESTLYFLWRSQGVEFRPHKRIQSGLRYTHHENGALMTIRYAADENWSKCLRDKPLTAEPGSPRDSRTVLDSVADSIAAAFAGSPFVWMGNNDLPDDLFEGAAERLPNSPHGLNCYQHIDNVAVLSALNPPPRHFNFLAALGLDPAEVKRACYWQAVYQAVMRISVRNPEDKTPKTVIVMDRATADWLAGLFPGCAVAPLDGVVGIPAKSKGGRPRKHLCDADRKLAHRDRFKRELAIELDLTNGVEMTGAAGFFAERLRQSMTEFGMGRDQTLTTMGRSDLSALAGTVFSSIFEANPFDFMPLNGLDDLIDGLRLFHSTELSSKEDSGLISPAIFDPALSAETKRGLDNIRAIWGIWLDNDGGDLNPDQFARMFPRLRVVICNSYSSTRQKPRWRVFIPTTLAMSVRAYRAIVSQIMLTVNEAGFWSRKQLEDGRQRKSSKHHGFDMSKLVPCSLFYLPCQARDPADSFFVDYNDERRSPLDPYVWAKTAANRSLPEPVPEIVPAAPTTQPTPNIPVIDIHSTLSPMDRLRATLRNQQRATQSNWLAEQRQATITTWRNTAKGDGNRAFFLLASNLARLGIAQAEIKAILSAEAAYAHSPKERRQQIKTIMTAIRKRPTKMAA
jgi:hypothetical protein